MALPQVIDLAGGPSRSRSTAWRVLPRRIRVRDRAGCDGPPEGSRARAVPTNARSCLPAPSPAPPCAPAEPLASCPALPPPAPSLCLSIFFLSAMTEMQPSALKAVFPLRQAHLRRSRRPAASPHPNPCRAPSSSTWAAQPVGTGSTDAFALSRARRRGFGAFKHWVNRWVNRRFCPLMPPRPYGAFKHSEGRAAEALWGL